MYLLIIVLWHTTMTTSPTIVTYETPSHTACMAKYRKVHDYFKRSGAKLEQRCVGPVARAVGGGLLENASQQSTDR